MLVAKLMIKAGDAAVVLVMLDSPHWIIACVVAGIRITLSQRFKDSNDGVVLSVTLARQALDTTSTDSVIVFGVQTEKLNLQPVYGFADIKGGVHLNVGRSCKGARPLCCRRVSRVGVLSPRTKL